MAVSRRPVLSVIAGGATVLALASATHSQAAASPGARQHVIVVLRDQHTSVPATKADAQARVAATNADQARLVSDARSHGASSVRQLHVLNAFAVTASAAEVSRLRADSSVAEVVPDTQVALPRSLRESARTGVNGPVKSTVCPPNPSKPLLEPEALQLTHTAYVSPSTPSANQYATGVGVRVAFLADGLDVDNPDFIRPDGSHVFVDYQDFSGDGPLAPTSAAEAFGDASAIAAQGRVVYDLSDYVNPAHPLPTGCTIRVQGMAPGAELVGLKVFPAGGFAFNSAILAALDYAATVDKVDVINESFGSNQYPDTGDDPTAMFNEALVAAGITITTSSGDAGAENTIGSPGSTPGVIAVGATTSLRTYAQTTDAGIQLGNGSYASDNISGLSSSGVTQNGRTVDLVAPGDLGWALCTPNTDIWQGCSDNKGAPSQLQDFGGTSQAAPLTAGAAADVIQAYRDSHHGTTPAPQVVKQLLTSTATDLSFPGNEQGAGLIDVLRAVRAARALPGSSVDTSGNQLLVRPTQLDVTTVSGHATTRTVTVHNGGTAARTITPSLRSEDHVLRSDQFSVTLSAQTDPTFIDAFGTPRAYRVQRFSVPSGTDRLAAAIAWPSPTAVVRVVLVDPNGTYQAFSQPQGSGAFGLADVRNPAPGTWKAYVWTIASPNGFAGAVSLTTTSYHRVAVGSVSPTRLTLAPGATGSVQVTIPAGDGGDTADALQFGTPAQDIAGVVPVVVRTLIATDGKGGSFSGTFGGGNGRAGIPNPSRTYAFDVPSGRPDLSVALTVGGNANQAIYGFLIDPNGEPVSEKTNQTVGSDGSTTFASSMQFTHRSPDAGRWRLVFAVFGPVAGTTTATPYTGSVRYSALPVDASEVPNSLSTVLAAGTPVKATVQFLNNGAASDHYFVDARTNGPRVDLPLVGKHSTDYHLGAAPLPPFPAYRVPTETTAFDVSAVSGKEIGFEVSPFPADHITDLSFEGDPDREAGPFGTNPSVQVADPIVAAQTWLALPSQVGPFDAQASKTMIDFTATAHTLPFDAAVTSNTGDPLLAGVQKPAPRARPITVTPGGVGTLRVTINPTGAPGDVVRGTLYIDTIDPVTGSSDEVAAIPYAYTVG